MPTLVTYADFVAAFPEFSDATKYAPSQFDFYADEAEEILNRERFGARLKTAIFYYVAHNLALSRQAALSAGTGGVPGLASGVLSSKSAGPLSKSYDTANSLMKGGETWNLTIYGQNFYRMMRRHLLGPVYVRGSGSFPRPF